MGGSHNPMYGKGGEDHPCYGYQHDESTKKVISLAGRGENNGGSVLTKCDVREIRWLVSETDMIQREIGKRYNVNQARVSSIKRRDSWEHVSGNSIPEWFDSSVEEEIKKRRKRTKREERKKRYKLNKIQVQEIKWILDNTHIFIKELSDKYNISQNVIYSIKRGDTWEDLDEVVKPDWYSKSIDKEFQRLEVKRKREKVNKISKNTRGENHPNSKLNKKDVKEIKWLVFNSNMTQGKIGEKYQIVGSTVSEIKTGKYWSFVSEKRKPEWFDNSEEDDV